MRRLFAVPLLILGAASCSTWGPVTGSAPVTVSASPAEPSVLPSDVVTRLGRIPATGTPPALPEGPLSLPDAVRIALENSPDTRGAWLRARAALENVGSSRSEYLPELDLDAGLSRQRQTVAGQTGNQTTYGPTLALSALLFDFGGRAARVDEARALLIAATLLHSASVQDLILRTERSFYDVLDAKALLAAAEATRGEQLKSLEVAQGRHRAGVATIADVLQAQTAASEGELTYQTAIGRLRIAEGTMAAALGVPPQTSLAVGTLPTELPPSDVEAPITELLDRARGSRPLLGQQRALALHEQARVADVRSRFLPTLSLAATAGRTRSAGVDSTPVSAAVLFHFPLFSGFRNRFDVRAAEQSARAAEEDVEATELEVGLEVWTSYYSMQTARARVTATRDLLASAEQSASVATGRYREGVGSILDVLNAQAALANARSAEISARTDWFVAFAQLSHDVGTLTPPGEEKRTP